MWISVPALVVGVALGGAVQSQALELCAAGVQAVDQQPVREKVDINRATAAELEQVPGIGPATAKRIIEWREQHGSFETLDDLLNIRGIGVKSLEKLRPYLIVVADVRAA